VRVVAVFDFQGLAALVTSVATLLGVVLTRSKIGAVASKVEQVHEAVNGETARKNERISQLSDTIVETGGQIPAPAHPPGPVGVDG